MLNRGEVDAGVVDVAYSSATHPRITVCELTYTMSVHESTSSLLPSVASSSAATQTQAPAGVTRPAGSAVDAYFVVDEAKIAQLKASKPWMTE